MSNKLFCIIKQDKSSILHSCSITERSSGGPRFCILKTNCNNVYAQVTRLGYGDTTLFFRTEPFAAGPDLIYVEEKFDKKDYTRPCPICFPKSKDAEQNKEM